MRPSVGVRGWRRTAVRAWASSRNCVVLISSNATAFMPLRISPEAGTTKTGKARTVPLHEHLVEQGFLAFVTANGAGPLFYNESKQPSGPIDPTNPRKPRYVKAREQVATWVRRL